MTHTITFDQIDMNATYSVKDNSPRGCHTAYGHALKIGDKIVINNYFHEIIDASTETTETTETTDKQALADTVRDYLDPATLDGYSSDFATDYAASDSAYICDAFAEFADGHTSIYYSDIMAFIASNPESLADVVAEGLYYPANDYDVYKHGQAAEYMTIERELFDNQTDILKTLALEYIDHIATDEQAAAFLALSDDEKEYRLAHLEIAIDHADRLDDIADAVNDLLEMEGGEND